MLLTLCIGLAIIAFGANVINAASYYVATNGLDSNSGTLLSPFRTIQKAGSVMVAGDTCYIRGGLYRETVVPAHSGTSVSRITFASYNGEPVVVSGADLLNVSWNVYSNSIYTANTTNVFRQLFVDGEMMNEARWPNASVDQLLTEPRAAVGASGTNVFFSDANLPSIDLLGATLQVFPGTPNGEYAANTRVITNYNSTTKTLYWAAPTAYTVNAGNPYYLYGKLSLLDIPTEWCLDGAAGKVYLWTTSGTSPTNHTVEIKTRAEAFVLDNLSYLTVTGICVFAAGISMSNSSYSVVDNCHLRYSQHSTTADWVLSGIPTLAACIVSGTGNIWRNSSISFSSQDGITITGGTSCMVSNCVIRNVDYYPGNYYAAVKIFGSSHQVVNCTFTNSGRALVLPDGLSLQIASNIMGCAQMLTRDGGASYVGSAKGGGTSIHHNWVYNSDVGIYLDNGSTNFIVYRNVCWGNNIGLTLNSPSITNIVCNNTLIANDVGFSTWPTPSVQTGTIVDNTLCDSAIMAFGSGVTTNKNGWFPPVGSDFVPQSGSGAIDNGIIFSPYTDGYVGSGPDIGAYEVGATVWTPGASLSIPTFPLFYKPATPTSLNAQIVAQQVQLNWTESTGATSYNILRSSTKGGPYVSVGTTASPSYTDGTVTNGNYYYVVYALNNYGQSGYSAEVSAIILPPALLFYDGFNYTAGTTVGTSSGSSTMNGGTGWSSGQNWFDNLSSANLYTVTNPGLVYNGLTVAGNALWQAGDSIGAERIFNSSGTSLAPGTYYVSCLIRFNGNSGNTSSMYGGMQIGSAYFGIGNTTANGGSTTNREFIVSNSYGNGNNDTTRILTRTPLIIGATYLLIAKLEFSGTGTAGSDRYSLWINPLTSDEVGAGAPQAVNTTTVSTSLSSVVFYDSSTSFGMTVDEFRLGTTWASVTPGIPALLLSPTLSVNQTAGGFVISAPNAAPRAAFTLQSSSNMADPNAWRAVATNTPATNGLVRFTDPAGMNSGAVFYRTKSH